MKTPETVSLKDVVDYQTGFPFKSQQYTISGTRLLRGDNIGQGSLRWDGAKFWPDIASNEITNFTLRKGDVVLAMDRPWIEAGLKYASVRESDLPSLLVQRVARLRETERIDGSFLRYLIGSAEFTEHILNITTGTAVPHISGKDILSFEFDLPAIATQREIAAVLGALDDKIEVNRKTAAVLEEMARALYRSWFVDFDPVWAKAEGRPPAHMSAPAAALFPDAFDDAGLPVGWKDATLGDVARSAREGADPSDIDPETPYIGLEHIPRRSIAIADWGIADDVGSTKSKMRVGQFLFGKLRPYFHKVALVPVDGICSTDILVVEAKHQRWSEFVLSVISSVELVDQVNAASTGTRMPRAKWQDLADYRVALAPNSVHEAFSALVRPMHQKILTSVQENQTVATLRDSLLPRLMSGELRVGAAREMLDEVA